MRSVIVRVALEDGSSGLGECPTSFVLKNETVPAIKGVLRGLAGRLKGLPVKEALQEIPRLRRKYVSFPMTLSGLEVALFRASLAGTGVTEHRHWGGRLETIETDITIPFLPDREMLRRWIRHVSRDRFRTYKVKVSGDPERDIRFLSTVHDELLQCRRDYTLRLDGNQGYTTASFLRMTDLLAGAGLPVELFEQPLPKDDLKGLWEVKKRSPIPIVLDETVFTTDDLRQAVEMDLCHGVNVKVAKSGLQESSAIMELARQAGLSLMIGCMTETMAGLSAAIYLALGTAAFDFIDLDGIHFLHHRNRYGHIRIEGPRFVLTE
jgi:L-alanine-DL-glutamate epimerase-like enolase superfamily enzyme